MLQLLKDLYDVTKDGRAVQRHDPTAKKVKGTKTANPPLPKEIVTYRRIHTYVAK
jgi:hypothetical protein